MLSLSLGAVRADNHSADIDSISDTSRHSGRCSPQPSDTKRGDFAPFLELDHLRVMVAQPEYFLAMKCLALRIGAEFHDEDDVRYLLRHLDIGTSEQAVAVITRYYPLERFLRKTLDAPAELLPPRFDRATYESGRSKCARGLAAIRRSAQLAQPCAADRMQYSRYQRPHLLIQPCPRMPLRFAVKS